MKRHHYLLSVASLACFSPVAHADTFLGKIEGYVTPPVSVNAEIMVMGFTPEIRVLAERVRSSITKNPQWLQKYTANLRPGEVAPYHQNFGVSESDYQVLINGTKALSLTAAGTTQLVFEVRADDTIRISGLPGDEPFDAVVYEAVSDSILSSYGILSKSRETTGKLGAADEMSWSGRLWSLERKEVDSQVSIVFALGRIDTTAKNLLIHEVTGRVNNEAVEYHYLLMWDTPQP